MGLKLIYGRAGSGKSKYCFDRIKENIDNTYPIYVITPEQFSFTAEQKLLETTSICRELDQRRSVINAEVITFNRMADRVFTEVGGANSIHLTKAGKSMLIYSILKKQKKNLKFLGNTDENVDVVSRTFKDFKKHNVTKERLKETTDKIEDKYLLAKLKDINLIYNLYEENLKGNYIDEDDVLTLLAKNLEQSEMFKDALIYIDEFAGFTTQEYTLIQSLLKIAKEVNVTICTDVLEEPNLPDTDIFYSNKVTAKRLMECAKEVNVEILTPYNCAKNKTANTVGNETKVIPQTNHIANTVGNDAPVVPDCTYDRFKSNELKHLEQNLYNINYKKYTKNNEDISLSLASNPYSEIEYVAKNIIKLVRDKKMRYRDIAVITKNTENYSSLVKAIFKKYKIPVFMDEEKDLSQNILVKYILSIIDIFSNNWSYESMFNYIKTGFLNIDKNDIFKLENYCIKYGIKGKKWYDEDFKYGEDEEILNLNELRLKIVTPLVELKNNISKNKTVSQISKELYMFLINNKIFEEIYRKQEYLRSIEEIDTANEYEASIQTVINLLDEIVLIFKDEQITFDNYKELLKIGFLNSSLKNIPATLDQVIVGDVDRSRSHKVKAIFIIGLNDGVFPSVNKDEGFLNDEDREVLKQNNLEIAKGTTEQLYEDQFNIYKAFTTAEEKLFLSYPSTDRDSKALRPSILISKIKKINPNLVEISDLNLEHKDILTASDTFDELLANIRKYKDGEEIDDIWFNVYNSYNESKQWKSLLNEAVKGLKYTNKAGNIRKEYIEKLYGTTLKTSVSRLEQYKKCPFSFYLKYGLNVSEKDTGKIQAIDTGSFMHEVIDEFFDIVKQRDIILKDITKDEIKQIVNRIIEEKLSLKRNYIFTSTPKFIVLTNKLKKVILQSVQYIVYQLSVSNFEILGNEMSFSDGGEYPPITLDLEDGRKIEITGKIDRVDIAKMNDGKYIRIIDYKSSAKNIELNQVVAGLQIQLLTYMDAITRAQDVLPAGVLYFNLLEPFIKKDKNLTDEQIEEEIKKQFKMKGLVLADINIIKMMDNKLDKGYSNILPVYIDKEGSISENRSSIANKEDFEKMQKYINRLIKQISKEILSGKIEIKPCYDSKTKNTPCAYCKYKSICKFNTNENEYEYIGNLSKDECMRENENIINYTVKI